MRVNYVDSSVLIAILLAEPNSKRTQSALAKESIVQSSSLIESEILSVCKREEVEFELAEELLDSIDVVSPPSSLRQYVKGTIKIGYLRGADLHHIATALYLCGNNPKHITFWSFDLNQLKIAKKLGFKISNVQD